MGVVRRERSTECLTMLIINYLLSLDVISNDKIRTFISISFIYYLSLGGWAICHHNRIKDGNIYILRGVLSLEISVSYVQYYNLKHISKRMRTCYHSWYNLTVIPVYRPYTQASVLCACDVHCIPLVCLFGHGVHNEKKSFTCDLHR